MTHPISPRRLAANRANARASTGPKSDAGKARAARNALKHGLAAAPDRGDAAAIAALAGAIATDGADGGLALRIAAAALDLVRVRRVRAELLAVPAATEDVAARLVALERYERRATSRRRRLMRAAAPADGPAPPPRPGGQSRGRAPGPPGPDAFWQNEPIAAPASATRPTHRAEACERVRRATDSGEEHLTNP